MKNMARFVVFSILAWGVLGGLNAQEIITLTAPIAKPAQTTIKIERLQIDVVQKSISIQWLGNNSEAASAVYPTPAILNPLGSPQPSGATLLTALNKMNFAGANPSLVRRILIQLQTDGYVGAGTISGTPE